MTPDRIVVAKNGTELSIFFADGISLALSARRLRAACRCAHCQRARIDDRFPDVSADITITDVTPQGHFGINVAFSDGHARGIYPWAMLEGLRSV